MRKKEVIMIIVQKELVINTKNKAKLVGVYKQLIITRNKISDEDR
jgi:hypothetical protein